MRLRRPRSLQLCLAFLITSGTAGIYAGIPTTTMLLAASATAQLTIPVTITAIVNPTPTAGYVTFYDGTSVIATGPVANGVVTLETSSLPSGKRSIRARYWGNAGFDESLSPVVVVTIYALKGYGFRPSVGAIGAVQFSPFAVVTADFNRDGHLDLAVANLGSDTVTVLVGDGAGGFSEITGSPFPVGSSPIALAVGDFDLDGNLDLAVANFEGNNVTLLYGDGKGAFGRSRQFATGQGPSAAVVADFNSDGIPDIAVTNSIDDSVSILIGDGAGGFTPGPVIAIHVGSYPRSIAAADFNGDGIPDLATGNAVSADITILIGDGTGGFGVGGSLKTGLTPVAVLTADFNGDGFADLITANTDSNTLSVFLGSGSGAFADVRTTTLAAGNARPWALAIGEFNEDGIADLAITNVGTSNVTILYGSGEGTFIPGLSGRSSVGLGPLSIAIGDFNEDGRLDLATANNGTNEVTVLVADPELTINVMPTPGNATVGQDAKYTLSVQNGGTKTVIGQVNVSNFVPDGMTLKTATGDGWVCTNSVNLVSCSRSDPLAPGSAYPPISITGIITATACPTATDRARVQNFGAVNDDSVATPVAGCISVIADAGHLVVNTTGSLTVTATPTKSVPAGAPLTVTDVLPTGVTPLSASGNGWTCAPPTGQLVECSTNVGTDAMTPYPPISIRVSVSSASCPGGINQATATLAGAKTELFTSAPLQISGCLRTNPESIDFGSMPVGGQPVQRIITLTSTDNHALQLAITNTNTAAYSVRHNCFGSLNYGNACSIEISYTNPCAGLQTGTVTVIATSGTDQATYTVPLKGVGVPSAVTFALEDGSALSQTLAPDQHHAISVLLSPPPNAVCSEKPSVTVTFQATTHGGSYPTGTNFDLTWDPLKNALYTGTVAGQIIFRAQLGGLDIALGNGSAIASAQVPSLKGVIEKMTVSKMNSASLVIGVSGYSTPREVGSDAMTQVCLTFTPAAGAVVAGAATPFCALQSDIEIWYERPVSYPFGSRFSGSVTASFSGDASAIGQISAFLRNSQGDSAPYCLDLRSGDTCK